MFLSTKGGFFSPLSARPLPVLLEQSRPQHYKHSVEWGPTMVIRLATCQRLQNRCKRTKPIKVRATQRDAFSVLLARIVRM